VETYNYEIISYVHKYALKSIEEHEIEILSCDMELDTIYEKMVECKTFGNKYYKEKNYDRAIKEYKKSLA